MDKTLLEEFGDTFDTAHPEQTVSAPSALTSPTPILTSFTLSPLPLLVLRPALVCLFSLPYSNVAVKHCVETSNPTKFVLEA